MGISVEGSGNLIARLRAIRENMQPDNPEMRKALERIGLLIVAQAKANIRSQGLIDTGRLLNSVRHEFFKTANEAGVLIGSFGVPYAAIHEFGGTIRPKRAQYLTIPLGPKYKGRFASQFNLKAVKMKNNLFLVDPETGEAGYVLKKSVTLRARPYLNPAVLRHREDAVTLIREAVLAIKGAQNGD